MPLKSGKSNKVISENISELSHANPSRSQKQNIAIALKKAGKNRNKKQKNNYL